MIAKAPSAQKPNDKQKSLLDAPDLMFVQDGFRTGLPGGSDIEWRLRGVVHDTLSHPGSLARAQLAFALLTTYGFTSEQARDTGVAIEYFHTASLLFDDLPCMDNADTRRGHACPHAVYGESPAILGALSLITQAYAMLWRVIGSLPAPAREAAGDLVSECLGLQGILNGQAHDLFFRESDRAKSDVLRVAEGKTVTLIRLTLLLPARMAGLPKASLDVYESLARGRGLAYQILDDFKDLLMSEADTGKNAGRDSALEHPNLPAVMGAAAALSELDRHLDRSRRDLDALRDAGFGVPALGRLQGLLEGERERIAALMSRANGATIPVL